MVRIALVVFLTSLPILGAAEPEVSWYPSDTQSELPLSSKPPSANVEDWSVEGSPSDPDDETSPESPPLPNGIKGPRPPEFVPDAPPSWLEDLDFFDDVEFPEFDWQLVKYILLSLLGLLVLGILIWVLSRVIGNKEAEEEDETNTFLNELATKTKNKDALSLAHSGDYALAIHALLLEVLRHLEPKHPIISKPSATPREIAKSIAPDGNSPLFKLVLVSELCTFAAKEAEEGMFVEASQWRDQILRSL